MGSDTTHQKKKNLHRFYEIGCHSTANTVWQTNRAPRPALYSEEMMLTEPKSVMNPLKWLYVHSKET